jgi:hypothetical protein
MTERYEVDVSVGSKLFVDNGKDLEIDSVPVSIQLQQNGGCFHNNVFDFICGPTQDWALIPYQM